MAKDLFENLPALPRYVDMSAVSIEYMTSFVLLREFPGWYEDDAVWKSFVGTVHELCMQEIFGPDSIRSYVYSPGAARPPVLGIFADRKLVNMSDIDSARATGL